MSGLRGLLREAGRAASLVRRLDQSLDSARRVASSAESTLIGVEQRLEPLTGAADPFATLASVVDRAGSRQEPDAPRSGIVRRPAINAGRFARGVQPAGPHAPDSVAAVPVESGRFAAARNDSPAAGRTRSSNNHFGPARPGGVGIDVSNPQVIAPELSTVSTSSQLVAATRAADAVAVRKAPSTRADAVGVREASALKPRGIATDPHVSAADAAGIFVERMRAATTLDAFRTVVRVSSPAHAGESSIGNPQYRRSEPHIAGDGAPDPRWQRALAPTSVDRVTDATAPITSTRRMDTQTDAPQASNVPDEARDVARDAVERRGGQRVPDTVGRPSWLTGDNGLTGLRRLAALATESLGEPAADHAAVRPVPPSESARPLDEELERILRSEALSHGIDVDGQMR